MSGVLRPVRSYSLERRLSLWTPSVEPSRPRPRGVPPAPLGASPSSVPVFFVLLPAVSRCSSLSLLLLPVVFIPSRRNERLPRRDARGPCPGRDAIPGQRFGAAPSFAVIAERHGGQSATPTRDRRTSPASAGCACVRRRRPPAPRPGASVPQGWLRFLGGGGSFFGVTGGPCAGVRQTASGRRRGREPAPGRRALAGPALCAATGICSRIAYERVGRRGAGVLRPGVSTYSLPYRSPPRGPCSFPRRFREARWNRRSEGGGSPVPAGTAKGSGSRDCASWQPPAAQAPTDRSDSTATTTSTEGVTWICSRCSVPWTRTSIDLARARAAFVAGHGPQVVAERRARDRVSTRTRPAAGTRCRRLGQRQRRRARIHARRAPGPTPGGTPPVRAGIGNRARTRPWQVDSRCSGTGPWPDGVAGQAPLAP